MFLEVLGVCRLYLLCNLLGFQTASAIGIPLIDYTNIVAHPIGCAPGPAHEGPAERAGNQNRMITMEA